MDAVPAPASPVEPEAPPAPQPMAGPPGTTCSPSTCWAWNWLYRLISLVDRTARATCSPASGRAPQVCQELGFLPTVHVRDNLELKPSAYRITLRGVVVGEGEAFPACSGHQPRRHHHAPDRHPHHRPWHSACQHTGLTIAKGSGYKWRVFTVVDSETVMATHLSHLMQSPGVSSSVAPKPSNWWNT